MGSLRTANKLIFIGLGGYVFYLIETNTMLWRMDVDSAFTWIFAFVVYDFFTIGFTALVMSARFLGFTCCPSSKRGLQPKYCSKANRNWCLADLGVLHTSFLNWCALLCICQCCIIKPDLSILGS